MDPEFENHHHHFPPGTSFNCCCLVCAQLVLKSEPDDDENVEETGEEDPVAVWNYFLEMFGIGGANQKDKDRRMLGWDLLTSEPELVPLPLCGDCKEQLLRPLLELQREVDRLMEMIEAGRTEIREKSKRSEQDFRERGVYEEDERIHRLRWQMLGREVVENRMSDSSALIGVNYHSSKQKTVQGHPRSKKCSSKSNLLSQRKRSHMRVTRAMVITKGIKSISESKSKRLVDDDDDVIKRSSSGAGADNPDIFDERDEYCNEDEDDHHVISQLWDSPETESGQMNNNNRNNRRAKRKKRILKKYESSEEDNNDDEAEDYYLVPVKVESTNNNEDVLEEDLEMEEEDMEEAPGKNPNRASFDRKSGAFKYLHVTMERVDDEKNKFKCSVCSQVVVTIRKNSLRSHVERHHSGDRTKCRECGTVTPNISALKKHIRRVHQGLKETSSMKPCPVCGKKILTTGGAKEIRDHLWTHYSEEERRELLATGDKTKVPSRVLLARGRGVRYQCPVCGHQASGSKQLGIHMSSTHPGQQQQQHYQQEEKPKEKELCPKCGKSFVGLENHIKRVHDPVDPHVPKRFVCSLCAKVFGNVTTLARHEKTHDKQFKCWICYRPYSTEHQLRRHHKAKHCIIPTTSKKYKAKNSL